MNLAPFEEFAESVIPPAAPEMIDGLPALQLPGDGHLVGNFAAELGNLLQGHGIFARKGCAFTIDSEGQKLEPASPAWLRTWVEKHVRPYKVRQSEQ